MSHKKNNTLLFQKVIPSYRVTVFRALYDRFGTIVCHSLERKNATWRSFHDRMNFPNERLSRFYYGWSVTNVVQNVFPPLVKYRPKIVISEFSLGYLTFWLLFLLKPLFRYKLVAWTHGIRNRDLANPFQSFRSLIELHVYRMMDAVLLYSQRRRDLIEHKIGSGNKLFVAQNTLDTELMNSHFDILSLRGKEDIKKELHFANRYNLLFIGRLLKNKRIDLLLDAYALLRDRGLDVGLHFIGDGPEQALIEQSAQKLPSIRIHGAIYDEDILGKYIFASDLTVNPGNLGLSIVHAFAYGSPMVTCSPGVYGPFHGPEIEYLHDGRNGIFCSLSAESLADSISGILSDKNILEAMSASALETARNECSLSIMLAGFEDLFGSLQRVGG